MWSKKHKCCVVCSTIDRKHIAKGMCTACYLSEYRNGAVNKARSKQLKHDWYVQAGNGAGIEHE